MYGHRALRRSTFTPGSMPRPLPTNPAAIRTPRRQPPDRSLPDPQMRARQGAASTTVRAAEPRLDPATFDNPHTSATHGARGRVKHSKRGPIRGLGRRPPQRTDSLGHDQPSVSHRANRPDRRRPDDHGGQQPARTNRRKSKPRPFLRKWRRTGRRTSSRGSPYRDFRERSRSSPCVDRMSQSGPDPRFGGVLFVCRPTRRRPLTTWIPRTGFPQMAGQDRADEVPLPPIVEARSTRVFCSRHGSPPGMTEASPVRGDLQRGIRALGDC